MRIRQGCHPVLPERDRYDDSFNRCIRQGLRAARAFDRRMRRRSALTAGVVLLCVGVTVGGGVAYAVNRVGPAKDRAESAAACTRSLERLDEAYAEASELRDEARGAFSSFDESYDLDRLAEVYDLEIPSPPSCDCSTDPDAASESVESAIAELERYSGTMREALGR